MNPIPPRRARSGTLYCVAGPIGNSSDITLRAIEVLKEVGLIASEDTRSAARLLSILGIREVPLISCFEHNEDARVPRIVSDLRSGTDVALLSEAGTPTISDPGLRLVQAAVAAGISIVPIPGPCAAIAALSASGLPTDRFLFLGFPPKKTRKRNRFVQQAVTPDVTTIVYLPARSVAEFLADVSEEAPLAHVVVAREISKTFEEFIRGPVGDVLGGIQERELKGECTVLIRVDSD